MKIGLVRHFKVNLPFPKKSLLSKSEVLEWFAEYDSTVNIEYKHVDLGDIQWKRCYSSSMIRAMNTATHIYAGEIIETADLKEFDNLHQLSDRIKLPFMVWGLVVRIKTFSSSKNNIEFKNRIIGFVDKILANNDSDILIVSHWFVMRVIRTELIKRGLVGGSFKSNDYGTLYVYEMDR